MLPLWLAPLVAVAGILLLQQQLKWDVSDGEEKKRKPSRSETRELLRARAAVLAQALQWPELVDLVDATAATESAWNLRPYDRAPKPFSNAAVGPLQLRPKSAGDTPDMREIFLADPTFVEDDAIAVAAGTAYWARLSDNNPRATLGDVRASFAFPVFIHGRPTKLIQSLADKTKHKTLASQQGRYDQAIRSYKKALRRIGLPESMVTKPAYPRVIRTNVTELLPLIPSERGADLIAELASG